MGMKSPSSRRIPRTALMRAVRVESHPERRRWSAARVCWRTDLMGTEDIIGEATILPVLQDVAENKITLNQDDRDKGNLVAQIKSAAERHGTELPDGWKPEVARQIVVKWSTTDPIDMPTEILDRAEALFKELTKRFDGVEP